MLRPGRAVPVIFVLVPVIFNAHFKSCAFMRDLTPSKLCVWEGHWLGRYRFFREEKGPEGRGNCSPAATEAVQPPKEPRGKDIKKEARPGGSLLTKSTVCSCGERRPCRDASRKAVKRGQASRVNILESSSLVEQGDVTAPDCGTHTRWD
jgi:hypothetical protein